MSYKFFNRDIYEPYSYLLLSVFHNNINHCGCYYNGTDREYIISLATGEKFYNLYDFIYSIKGLGFINDDVDCLFYDEIIKQWFPIYYL